MNFRRQLGRNFYRAVIYCAGPGTLNGVALEGPARWKIRTTRREPIEGPARRKIEERLSEIEMKALDKMLAQAKYIPQKMSKTER